MQMNVKQKQGGVTLKEYLAEYLAVRSPKSATGHQTLSTIEHESEKTFNRKIVNIKKIIKSYIRDTNVLNLLEKQLEDLKNVFFRNKNINMSTCSKDMHETTRFTKKERKTLKANISIPIIPIYDESLDELRTTNLAPQNDRTEVEVFETPAPKNQKTYRKSKTQDQNKEIVSENNCESQHQDHAPKLYKAYSREYITKVIPATMVKTPKSKGEGFDFPEQSDCLPPRLQKMDSEEYESLRNTNNSKNSEAQSRMFHFK